MPFKEHDRQYDLVVFGATGYTGVFTAEHITTHLPSNLRWAVAGRSESKLRDLVADCKKLNPDRVQPEIEVCALNTEELEALAKKTFCLIATVGPYSRYGELAFKACANQGSHYLDCTGEVPWTAKMISKYENTAKATGALLFPQIGVESAPSDLCTWLLATLLRKELSAKTGAVTVSIHKLNSAPSGGTLATALGLFDVFSIKEVRDSHKPFALSPLPNRNRPLVKRSLITRLTGLCTVPNLGLMTTSIAGMTDTPIVQRTWGLLAVIPSRERQFYGPNFSFKQYMTAKNWIHGIAVHWALTVFGFLLATTPPFRSLVRRFVYQPGQGPEKEVARRDEIEYRGVAIPDIEPRTNKQAYVRAWFSGSMYYMTGVLLAQAALTILEDELDLPGGIYTPSCLGQPFVDRLDEAGFKFEIKMLDNEDQID